MVLREKSMVDFQNFGEAPEHLFFGSALESVWQSVEFHGDVDPNHFGSPKDTCTHQICTSIMNLLQAE